MNQIKISSYSDILSSTASSLKTRETPILVRQECIYEPELGSANNKSDKPAASHITFKTNSASSTKNGSLNAAFNQHEPLSVNSETHFSNADKLLIYEDLKSYPPTAPPPANNAFRHHLDNCSNSLVKLVTISQQISNLAESNKMFCHLNLSQDDDATVSPAANHTYNTVLNDSSLISEPVDNHSNNGHHEYYEPCCFEVNKSNVKKSAAEDPAELYANHKKLPSKPPHGFRDTITNARKTNKKSTNSPNACMINTSFNLDATATSTSSSTPSSSSNYNNLDTTLSTYATKNDSLNSNYFNNTSNTNTINSHNSNEGLITKFSIINVDKNEVSPSMKTFPSGCSSGNPSFWTATNHNGHNSRISLIKQKLGVESSNA